MTEEVDEIIRLGRENPLSDHERRRLLRRTLEVMRDSAARRGDRVTLDKLSGNLDEIVERIMKRVDS